MRSAPSRITDGATTPCRRRRCRRARNGVADFIPVARIADMLLNPGGTYRYNGQTRTYPDIRLVYWAGGNPFHHHQDINRLRKAFAQVDTLVVHELGWTATARHADIVLPATMTLEREDIGATPTIRCWCRCTRLRRRSARRATITRSSPISPSGSARAKPSPKAATSANGWSICTSRPAGARRAQFAGAEFRRILGTATA